MLVEPHLSGIAFKNRKASSVYHCLAVEEKPHYVEFEMDSVLEIDPENNKRAMGGIVKVRKLH